MLTSEVSHFQLLLTLFKGSIVIRWTLLHPVLLSAQVLEEEWGWEPRTGHFPSLSSASCPDNLVGKNLLYVWRRRRRRENPGTVPALEKGMEGREDKKKREGRSVTVRSQRAQSLLLFLASLCVSRATGMAEQSTNFTPRCTRGPE